MLLIACAKNKIMGEEEAKEAAIQNLQMIAQEIADEDSFLSLANSRYIFAGDLIGDIEWRDGLPEFEMHFEDSNSITFLLLQHSEDEKAWVAEVQVQTSWGDVDPVLHFCWFIKLDETTGALLGTPVVSGNYR